MNAALATTAWTLAASAAGVLASRKHGEASRQALKIPVPRGVWTVWAWSAVIAGATTAITAFGAGVGVPSWLSALAVCGSATVATAHAWPRTTGTSVLISTAIAALATGALAWMS